MTRKDIALTVGGVVATMVLAYLLYQAQKRDAAQAAANAAADQAQQVADATQQESYLQQLPTSFSSGSGTYTLATSNEGSTDTTASNGTDGDAATESLLSSIIASFAGSINQPVAGAGINASLIPTINSGVNLNLASVPTTPAGFEAVGGPILPTATQQVPISTPTEDAPVINVDAQGPYNFGNGAHPLSTLLPNSTVN